MKTNKTIHCTKGYLNALGFDKEKLVRELIHNAKGKFISGTFVKSDGSIREFNGKETIYGALAGGKSTLSGGQIAFIDNNVYQDLLDKLGDKEQAAKKSWRSFKVDKLRRLSVSGIDHLFEVEP